MLKKTTAIVLRTFKYSETSIIAKLYTEEFGLLSFMVHGVRKRKSKMPASMFQALQVVSLEIEHKEKSKLHRLKEINLAAANNQIHSKIYKSTQAQFLAEVLYKTVREEEANSALFDYIVASMAFLNEEEESNIGNFHLVFLIGLSRFLGFFPSNNYSPTQPNFNMMSGEFVSSLMYQNGFDGRQGELFSALLDSNLSNMSMVKMSGENRRLLLNGLLHFYQIHLPEMGDIQSLEVLEELFS